MVDSDQFRANFTAFRNPTIYSDAMVQFWLQLAYQLLNPWLWGALLDVGAQLFTAHNLVLEGVATAEAANGAPPAQVVGPVVTKTVGELTITYDVASGVDPSDTSWNLSTYGTRFIKMAKQIGTAPAQLGIGRAPPQNGPAWNGPPMASYGGIWPY
jgi:hypothetical protein